MRYLFVLGLLASVPSWSRSMGTSHVFDPFIESLRHRQYTSRPSIGKNGRLVKAVVPDSGNIAILDEGNGVVSPAGFDLGNRTLEFRPLGTNASGYNYSTADSRFDANAPGAATAVALGDDEAKEVGLPFSFPFYGLRYNSVFIHSDGNVTFGAPEASSFTRDFERLVVGPPRAAPLFEDLDPSQPNATISYASDTARFLITWNNVPLYDDHPGPTVPRQTFQLALYPDGRLEFSYRTVNVTEAVVGMAPGGATRIEQIAFVDFSAASQTTYSAAIVEEFSNQERFDFVALVQKFYQNHEDPYDFLVIFDNAQRDFNFCAAALPLRNWAHGIGLRSLGIAEEFDDSGTYGSGGRLQNMIYMGPLSRYPADPTQVLPLPGGCGRNSVLSILGQEAGHRFMAYTRFMDPATGRPSTDLLGRDNQHWSFYFNSDASFVEGNQIEDKGPGVSPRFETKQIVQRYSALDHYLMGLRAPEDVPPSFLVRQASIDFPKGQPPQAGVLFDGTRVDITVPMIVAAEGRRAPDYTVSPKHFRFAFALLTPEGKSLSETDLAKLDRYRVEWEPFFARAVENRATIETRLVKQLSLSVWPAAGLIQGKAITATVTLGAPAGGPVTVNLSASGGQISVPGAVTIPAGQRSAEFSINANTPGIAELTARGPDDSYEVSRAFLQVRSGMAGLRMEQLWTLALNFGLYLRAPETGSSGGLGLPLGEEVIFRVRDENFLPYPGLRVNASPSGSGAVSPAALVTDSRGWVRINWRLDTVPGFNTLNVALDGQSDVSAKAQVVGAPEPVRRRDPRQPADPVP